MLILDFEQNLLNKAFEQRPGESARRVLKQNLGYHRRVQIQVQLTPRQVLRPGCTYKPANRHGIHSLNNKLKAIHKPSETDKRLQSGINFAYKLIGLLLVRNEVLPETVPVDAGHLQYGSVAGGFY